MRLFLADNIIIPSSGVFGFKMVGVKDALLGIGLAIQEDRFVNYLSDAENARRLSRLTGEKLGYSQDVSVWVQSIEEQMEHRDTLMMYYTTPTEGQNGSGKLFSHTFLMAVKWDFSTVMGVGDLVRLSCPAGQSLTSWIRDVGAVTLQLARDVGDIEAEVNIGDGEVSDE